MKYHHVLLHLIRVEQLTYAYECDSCRDYLFKYQLEEAVQARREAMQLEKAARAPATQTTTTKARL